MYPRNRSIILAFSLILVLAVSAMSVQPALADDSTPPPAPSTGSVPVNKTGNDLAAKVSAGTDVVVLDRSGNSVPLASQKAAQIVASGDPIWCPKGVAPRPSLGGCSPAFNGFTPTVPDTGLLSWLPSAPSKAGVVWIAGSYDSGGIEPGMTSLTFNGATLTNLANFSLTIKGGWNGIAGKTITDPTTPSLFNTSVSIINWRAPIAISDILVSNVMAANPNPGYPYGLLVRTDKGGITLNRVQVIDNDSLGFVAGAYLDTSNATLGHPAPVTVNDSVFSHNFGNGLEISSDGAVNIRNLTADFNGDSSHSGNGTDIYNYLDNPNQPVTLTGTNEFKSNYGDGLDIVSYGIVTLNNITAYYNDDNGSTAGGNGYGVYIINNVDTSPSNVKLAGTNLLTYNANNGLFIKSNGNIYLNNLTASFNGGNGVLIRNDDTLLKAQPVTISGTNAFYGNTLSGLEVYSFGAIKLSNITANDNGQGGSYSFGVYLDNQGYDANAGGTGVSGATVITRMPVTLTGVNTFNNNGYLGLTVASVGAISVSNVTASNNGLVSSNSGVLLENDFNWYPNKQSKPYAANVTLKGFGTFDGNGDNGITIYSKGAVTVANLTANSNYNSGAYIQTYGSLLAPHSVTLSGMNTFNHNGSGSTLGDGLDVISDGQITISNLSAIDNKVSGAYLDNYNHALANKFLGVTLTGFNFFQNNKDGDGLFIITDGSATMSHIEADGNSNPAAGIGVGVAATRNVTLKCAGAFGNFQGLYLSSGVTLTLIGVHSNYNPTPDYLSAPIKHIILACP